MIHNFLMRKCSFHSIPFLFWKATIVSVSSNFFLCRCLSVMIFVLVQLDLFTTLKALGFLGAFLLFVGHRILSHLAHTSAKLKSAWTKNGLFIKRWQGNLICSFNGMVLIQFCRTFVVLSNDKFRTKFYPLARSSVIS